ncbi:hypothetical protein SAY87_019631 [Trapa incisa]|uniref:Uncharacterized protein n=1 Tax=Trapa incisa TaxID=236973 RepID=A0AAN7Q7L8_9MYRT|nr:hypothetical protein SAY87_019631 [Trapa incisa]
MLASRKKIHKDKDAEPYEFEDQALYVLLGNGSGSKHLRFTWIQKSRTIPEYKLESFYAVYRKLAGKDVAKGCLWLYSIEDSIVLNQWIKILWGFANRSVTITSSANVQLRPPLHGTELPSHTPLCGFAQPACLCTAPPDRVTLTGSVPSNL